MSIAYRALALQTTCRAVNGCPGAAEAAAMVADNITRVGRQIRASKAFIGQDLKLVVLPEYFATSYPLGDTIPGWAAKGSFAIDGPEYEQLGRIAQDNGVYLCANAYERDPHFPDLYFQASVILDDSGNQILRYRRLISLYAPSPHDVWDRYLDAYGIEGVFPVADTVIGRLAAIASEEILYPEVARCLAVRGAEVFVHPSSEVASPDLTIKQIARRARALENLAYVVSANNASLHGIDVPIDSSNGFSDIIDFQGKQMIVAGVGESSVANITLDMAALRAWRRRPGMPNMLARQALDLFAGVYAQADLRRKNGLLDGDRLVIPDRSYFLQRQADTLTRMRERGVIL